MDEVDGQARGTTLASIEWCRRLMASLNIDGVWAVPRSGIVFRKADDTTLVVHERMPWMDGMPVTPAEVKEAQDVEIAEISRFFGMAGIEVVP